MSVKESPDWWAYGWEYQQKYDRVEQVRKWHNVEYRIVPKLWSWQVYVNGELDSEHKYERDAKVRVRIMMDAQT